MEEIVHASCVAAGGKGVLIRGPSGSGKSALALDLMSRGARLVADDRTVLRGGNGAAVIADAPGPIRGLIEARGVGLLRADAAGPVALALVIEMGEVEQQRLPPQRSATLMGTSVPLLHNTGTGYFAPAILQYLACGRAQ